jgi:hypothetical protein
MATPYTVELATHEGFRASAVARHALHPRAGRRPRAVGAGTLAACASCPPHFAFARRLREAIAASAPVVSDDDEARLRARLRRALASAGSGER